MTTNDNLRAQDIRPVHFSFFRAPVTNKVPADTMTLADAYAYLTGPEADARTQRLRAAGNLKEARLIKVREFDYVTFSGQFSYGNDAGLISHSGLLCLDFDHVGDVSALRARLLADPCFPTQLLFTSPSGDGVKWVVPIDLAPCGHRTWFRALRNYVKATYGLDVDEKCVNVSRACFLPHDSEAYIAPELLPSPQGQSPRPVPQRAALQAFNPLAWAAAGSPEPGREPCPAPRTAPAVDNPQSTGEQIRQVADLLVGRGIDITDDYNDWLRLGFALARALGESGRPVYHRLSSMSRKYRPDDCDRQYDRCLRSPAGSVSAATFFWMAKNAGIDISRTAVAAAKVMRPSGPEGVPEGVPIIIGENQKTEPLRPSDRMAATAATDVLPADGTAAVPSGLTFSDCLRREDLPSFLYPVLDSQDDDAGRDKMLLGTLNLISGMLPASLYSIYDRRRVYAPLYNIVYGRFATAKGDLEAVRQLAAPLRQEMQRDYEAALADYRRQHALWEATDRKLRGPEPEEPLPRSPFVSANSSASAVYREMEANGGWGMMFETEADTLSNMLSKSEYGDYTDLLRKAHHHETVAMVRVSDRVNIEIAAPRLSVFLTCTGSQLPLLLPAGNVANGLASRFLFYALPDAAVEFRDVFKGCDQPVEDVYRELGERFMPLYHALLDRRNRPLQFIMTPLQQHDFVAAFSAILHEQASMMGDGIQGYVFRLALECYRYAMVLSALRRLSERTGDEALFDDDEQAIVCDERDYATAVTIINCLVNHTGRVVAVLGQTDDDPFSQSPEQPSARLRAFYQALPATGEILPGDVAEAAARNGIPERTARRMLGELVTKYQVLGHPRRAVYVKLHAGRTTSAFTNPENA